MFGCCVFLHRSVSFAFFILLALFLQACNLGVPEEQAISLPIESTQTLLNEEVLLVFNLSYPIGWHQTQELGAIYFFSSNSPWDLDKNNVVLSVYAGTPAFDSYSYARKLDCEKFERVFSEADLTLNSCYWDNGTFGTGSNAQRYRVVENRNGINIEVFEFILSLENLYHISIRAQYPFEMRQEIRPLITDIVDTFDITSIEIRDN